MRKGSVRWKLSVSRLDSMHLSTSRSTNCVLLKLKTICCITFFACNLLPRAESPLAGCGKPDSSRFSYVGLTLIRKPVEIKARSKKLRAFIFKEKSN